MTDQDAREDQALADGIEAIIMQRAAKYEMWKGLSHEGRLAALGSPDAAIPATNLIVDAVRPEDGGDVSKVSAVISGWLTRNWSEVRDGAYPEMDDLTRELRLVFSERGRSKRI